MLHCQSAAWQDKAIRYRHILSSSDSPQALVTCSFHLSRERMKGCETRKGDKWQDGQAWRYLKRHPNNHDHQHHNHPQHRTLFFCFLLIVVLTTDHISLQHFLLLRCSWLPWYRQCFFVFTIISTSGNLSCLSCRCHNFAGSLQSKAMTFHMSALSAVCLYVLSCINRSIRLPRDHDNSTYCATSGSVDNWPLLNYTSHIWQLLQES